METVIVNDFLMSKANYALIALLNIVPQTPIDFLVHQVNSGMSDRNAEK